MIDECDELPDDHWLNDDEANDIMLAYAATDDLDLCPLTIRKHCSAIPFL
jgi:hypothetical protein